jgi:hypothetical protein
MFLERTTSNKTDKEKEKNTDSPYQELNEGITSDTVDSKDKREYDK